MSTEPTHVWRGVIVWERSDGSRFEWKGRPRLSKAAANGDVTRNTRYTGSDTFVSCRVERTLLFWYVVEVDGKTV